MKVMLPTSRGSSAGAEERRLGRFLEEAQVTGQLDHPGIVPVHEVGLDADGRLFFTMKLVKGHDLRSVFDALKDPHGEWTLTRVVGVLLRVCEAMSYAHAKDVVHRDLKPSNVMVGRFGEVLVMDWGLARVMSRADGKDIRLRDDAGQSISIVDSDRQLAARVPQLVTMDGDVVGTPSYMPPEQAEGRLADIGPPSDVYAVGAMLYHALSGGPPYGSAKPAVVVNRIIDGPPATLRSIAPKVAPELESICEKAMARVVGDRYPTMEALAGDLRAYLEGRVVHAHSSGALADLRKWIQRNRAVAVVSAAAVVALLAMTAGFSLFYRAKSSDLLRMSDLHRLDDLSRKSELLWPAHPSNIEAMERWIEDANELLANRPAHVAKLSDLEEGAATSAASGAPVFADEDAAWWHDTLSRLVTRLDVLGSDDPFGGSVVSMRARIAIAKDIAQRTLVDAADKWEAAISSIASECPQYDNLELTPQFGLIPLERDPVTGLWEFWHVQSGSRPTRGFDERYTMRDDTGMVLVLIPAGEFAMGAQADDPEAPGFDDMADSNESDVHHVELDAFFLSKYEMTQGQWERATGHNPSRHVAGGTHGTRLVTRANPVEQMSWQEAAFVTRTLDLTLPTEAQWEYAARGGTTTRWWTEAHGVALDDAANLADRYAYDNGGSRGWAYDLELDDGHTIHAQVGSLEPNPFGLHDVIGNVWEWTVDRFGHYGAPTEPGTGLRMVPEHEPNRVGRGGSYDFPSVVARVTYRRTGPESFRRWDVGLRPARPIRDEARR